MPIKIKPAKISKQKFLNALLYGRKRMQVKSITPKNLGTVIQFTWGLADERKTEPYKEFSTGFKNRKLSTLKVKFCAWTFLFFRSVFYLRSYLYYIRYFLACHLFMLTGSNLQVIVKKFHKINILVHMQWLIRIKN